MTRVLALIDHSHLDAPIIETGRTVADLVGARLDVVHVVAGDGDLPADTGRARTDQVRNIAGPVVETLAAELDADGVAVAVMGSRDLVATEHPLGHVTESLIVSASIPVVIVPPTGRSLPDRELRLLVPLDGDDDTSRAVASRSAVATWGQATVLHVFGAGSAPMFITSGEDRSILADEFAAKHAGDIASTVELRLGHAATEIIAAVQRLDIDAVVLGWHQRFSQHHAEVVRRLLSDGQVPLVLLPI